MASQQRPVKHSLARQIGRGVMGLLALIALALVVLGFIARPGADGVSRLEGHPLLTVLSGSMTPTFRPGDLVLDDPVTPQGAATLQPGDIITFHVAGSTTQLITHRIVAVKQAKPGANAAVAYQTKGDANNMVDPSLVSTSQVVGIYQRHIPLGGYLLRAVQKKTVFLLLIFLPLLYLAITEVAKRWNAPQPDAATNATDEPGAALRGVAPAHAAALASAATGGGTRGGDEHL